MEVDELVRAKDAEIRAPRQGTARNGYAVETQVRALRPLLWTILLVSVSAGLLAGLFRYQRPLPYASSVQVLVDAPPQYSERSGLMPSMPATSMAVYHAVTSTEVIDHLIDSFGLIARYGLDTSDPHAHAKATMIASDAIAVSYLDNQSLRITVYDPDRAMAQAMANAIPAKLEEMARRQAAQIMEKAAAVYANVLQRSEEQALQRTESAAAIVAEKLNETGKADRASLRTDLRDELRDLAFQGQQQADIQRALFFTDELMRQPALPLITVVRSALPDLTRSNRMDVVIAAVVGFVTCLVLLPLVRIGWHLAKAEWQQYAPRLSQQQV